MQKQENQPDSGDLHKKGVEAKKTSGSPSIVPVTPYIHQRQRGVELAIAHLHLWFPSPHTVSVPLTVTLGDWWDWLSKASPLCVSNVWCYCWLWQEATEETAIQAIHWKLGRSKCMIRIQLQSERGNNESAGTVWAEACCLCGWSEEDGNCSIVQEACLLLLSRAPACQAEVGHGP